MNQDVLHIRNIYVEDRYIEIRSIYQDELLVIIVYIKTRNRVITVLVNC